MLELRWTILGVVLLLPACSYISKSASGSESYTLYRGIIIGSGERIHIATFDAKGDVGGNQGNCLRTAEILQKQQNAIEKYWCERGPYKP